MIILKTFYIFKLNKGIDKLAKKTPYNIYLLFNTIYRYNKKDVLVAFNLFDELCIPINIEFFNKFIYDLLKNNDSYTKFKSIHMYHDYLNNEESKMVVKKSHIRIKSNKDNNIFINNINNLSNFFICDFKNDYYRVSGNSKVY